ncbi:uncharacterized protein LOC571594 [Danio rerio]|uniref:Si:dkey-13e3.1 protein n=1 Tax=Danio rerio TaxID=7955 RepID=A9JRC1_DANRE|nr:uncharacterized protein LOC571594 [Danio rerio]AAI55603.1 Si:dkey-13e3.1 protein [Danio rerio]|eukprot:NP_001106812.1 uncharacterized protein LOC571594 [Danio rerio]
MATTADLTKEAEPRIVEIADEDSAKSCKKPHNPLEDKLLRYIRDTERLADEVIVKEGAICLTRADFLTLGVRREMECEIGNACMILIYEEARAHGNNIYIADLYVVATWKSSKDPVAYFPNNADLMDALVLPAWIQATVSDHYVNIAQSLNPAQWTEVTGLNIGVLPQQNNSNDCGIFMLMYALYTVLDIPFNFSQVVFYILLLYIFNKVLYCWPLNSNNTN